MSKSEKLGSETKYTKPFLKWAGGKFRILDKILSEIPNGKRYVEPFAGSAAVYLNTDFEKALVCDINKDLIDLYISLQEDKIEYLKYCKSFFSEKNNTKEQFLFFRDLYNTSNDCKERGALLLYLNRHSFNGLIRYNAKGKYNVPFGKYKLPYFPEKELLSFIKKTEKTETVFRCCDFRETFSLLQINDVVYCDPPYIPLSTTSNFTAYSGNYFLEKEQVELSKLALAAYNNGIPVILSNHDTCLTRKLYQKAHIIDFQVQRFISCNGDARVKAPEILAAFR